MEGVATFQGRKLLTESSLPALPNYFIIRKSNLGESWENCILFFIGINSIRNKSHVERKERKELEDKNKEGLD